MSKTRGNYFSFKRGEWVKDDSGTTHYEASGLTYVGSLTRDQRDALDVLIRNYVSSLEDAHADASPAANAEDSKDAIAEYTPGDWFKARTINEMQAFFMSRLPAIREAAKEHGYAIGLHGSTRRDFDLMAMQWGDDPANKDTLAHAIAVAACGITREGAYQWEKKPGGRFAVSLPICWTDHANPDFKNKLSIGHIDLSVIDAAMSQDAKGDGE